MDLNFFHVFLHEKKKKEASNLKASIPLILALVIVIVIIGLTSYNMFTLTFLKKSIANFDITLNEPARIAQLKEIDEKQKEIKQIKAEKQFLEAVDSGLKGIDSVTQPLMNLIASKVTNNLFLTNINVNEKNITVTGNSLSRIEIAQFEYNLRASNLFDAIYVDSISKQEMSNQAPFYNFNMKFEAKESVYGIQKEPLKEEKKEAK